MPKSDRRWSLSGKTNEERVRRLSEKSCRLANSGVLYEICGGSPHGTRNTIVEQMDFKSGVKSCRLLSKHGVFLCSATLRECQTRQMPGVS